MINMLNENKFTWMDRNLDTCDFYVLKYLMCLSNIGKI